MTVEAEQQEHARIVRARLMGVRAKTLRLAKREFIPPEEPPEPRQPVLLPKPTRRELEALASEDIVWRDGVKRILKGFGENVRRLTGDHKDQHIIECRAEVAKFLQGRGWSFTRIGDYVNRDHSTVSNMLNPDIRRKSHARRKAARFVDTSVDDVADCTGAVFGAGGFTVAGPVESHGEASDKPQDMVEPTGRG